MVGATVGSYSDANGTLTVDKAGTIRGNGAYDGFDAPPDAGITIATANSSVVNSGTISGAGTGITTAYLFDEEIGELVFLAAGTPVEKDRTSVVSGKSVSVSVDLGGGGIHKKKKKTYHTRY